MAIVIDVLLSAARRRERTAWKCNYRKSTRNYRIA